MRSIAIINQKGGVGKTTTAVNLAAGLALQGGRVCVLDMDPQAHATLHLGISGPRTSPSIYDVLIQGTPILDALQRVDNRLSLVPGHIDLAAAEIELADEAGRENRLRDRVAGLDGFDYLIIDCPPSLGILTLNALTAVREVFLPLQPHFLALHGLSQILNTIDAVSRRLNRDLRLTGVVLCMYETGTRLAGEVSHDVNEFLGTAEDPERPWHGAKTFATKIRRNVRLAEAPSFGRSIHTYAPTSPGAQDYQSLAREVQTMSVRSATTDQRRASA